MKKYTNIVANLAFLGCVALCLAAATGKDHAAKPHEKGISAFSPIGQWRGVFELKSGQQIPFNFEIRDIAGKVPRIYFLNGDEHFDGGAIRQKDDSLFIPLDQFDNELVFQIIGDSLSGVLRRQDKTGTPLLLNARKNISYRFKETGVINSSNLSGTYDISFKSENGKDEKAVGLFKQEGSKLTATFLRITGDSRYLQGIVEGDSFYLSSFIGSSPAFYKGAFTKDGQLNGAQVGSFGRQNFTGIHNEDAALPDPYKLTFLKDGYKTFDFSFPDINGKLVSLKDEKYRNKVVIVTITGTWCPNCIDEASFLGPWYLANKARGVEIVSIHYERQTDSAFIRKVLTRFRERFGIHYDEVIGGVANKQVVASSLPALNNFLSFPTTIFVDRNGKLDKIHTGYSGPATGKYYDEFLKEFNGEIDALVR